MQPIASADGQLLDKFFLILQEKENEFGKRVEKDLIVPSNVVMRASKSGKSSGEKHRIFLKEVLRPLVGRKFLLFLDYWPTQTDMKKFRAVFPHQDSQLLIFPKGSTAEVAQSSLRILPFFDAIRCRITSENGVCPRKTSRIRPRFRRNLCGRIPDRITPEKIRSVLVESDYRKLSKTPESYTWKQPYHAGFYNGSSRILSESGNHRNSPTFDTET